MVSEINDAITVLEDRVESVDDFAAHVRTGLAQDPKHLSSKYFYDKRGSELFRQIMDLPEYYLTKCEHEILQTQHASIRDSINADKLNVIDLGAGDGAKTFTLLEGLRALKVDTRFCPIDISASAMAGLVGSAAKRMPQLKVSGVVSEYLSGLEWLAKHNDDRTSLVLLLGSNIGNFTRHGASDFLRSLSKTLNKDDVICVGFDLKKDPDVMIAAYADSQGVTAKFNTNLLQRINRELGGSFQPDKFKHYGTYNAQLGAMESHLMATEAHQVFIEKLANAYSFHAWEAIHTERSLKFDEDEIRGMALACGLEFVELLKDHKGWFVDALFRVK